jgi:HSP20 family protein
VAETGGTRAAYGVGRAGGAGPPGKPKRQLKLNEETVEAIMTYPIFQRAQVPALWSDLFSTRREIDRVFDRFFGQADSMAGSWVPPVDVRETKDAIEVVAELPGMKPEEVEVNIENNVLTIGGEKKHEVSEGNGESEYHFVERRYGRFERSFTLPRTVDADQIGARFHDGLLTITLPKAEAAKPRRVEIRAAK